MNMDKGKQNEVIFVLEIPNTDYKHYWYGYTIKDYITCGYQEIKKMLLSIKTVLDLGKIQ